MESSMTVVEEEKMPVCAAVQKKSSRMERGRFVGLPALSKPAQVSPPVRFSVTPKAGLAASSTDQCALAVVTGPLRRWHTGLTPAVNWYAPAAAEEEIWRGGRGRGHAVGRN